VGSAVAASERVRWTKESAGGFFATAAAFAIVRALVLEPVSQWLPDHEHSVTALAGILAATLACPLATRRLKSLPSSAPKKRTRGRDGARRVGDPDVRVVAVVAGHRRGTPAG
jgi:predicted outer membrane lipoprotein